MGRRSALTASALVGLAAINSAPALGVTPIGRRIWPSLSGLGRRGHTALTFDDGPDPQSTPRILDALAAMDCRATFFLLGTMVRDAPQLTADIVAAGHEIAVHGYHHRSTLSRTPRQLSIDIGDALETITAAAGQRPQFFRPPYGTLSASAWYVAQQLGLRTVLWTSWGRDWRADATADSVLADIRRGVLDGGTILLHDSDCTSAAGSWHSTLAALPTLLADLRHRGLEVGPLNQHWN